MMELLQTYKYTWKMLDEDVETILTYVDLSKYDMLVGIASGGLPLLTKLVHKNKISYEIIKCNSYEGREQRCKAITIDYPILPPNSKILLVDDVADTGKTLNNIIEHYTKCNMKIEEVKIDILTLCWKPHSIVNPKWYLHKVDNKVWINFPWE